MGGNAPGPEYPDAKPTLEQLEARWQKLMEEVSEQPRDPDILIRAGTLAEELGRKHEAFQYFQKALRLDPTKSFLVPRLRRVATDPEQIKEVETIARRPSSFGRALDDVFVYPVRGGGIGILILGAVFLYICRVVAHYNIFPFFSWIIMAITGAYMAMFYVDVVATTVTGSEDLPEWPDPARFREFFLDWAKIGMAYIAAFFPIVVILAVLIIYAVSGIVAPAAVPAMEEVRFDRPPSTPVVVEPFDPDMVVPPEIPDPPAPREAVPPPMEPPREVPAVEAPAPPGAAAPRPVPEGGAMAAVVLVLCGLFALPGFVYLPMAVLANCIYGHPLACLNPFFIFRAIGVARKNYTICVLAYFAVAVVAVILEVLARAPGIFLFSAALATLVEIYGGVVQMRILGIFYRMNQARLGWMNE